MTKPENLIGNSFLAPIAAWLAGISLTCAAAYSLKFSLRDPMTWARWDSISFLTIALRGYYIVYDPRMLNGHASFWSGNTGSLPLYSYLIRVLSPSIAWMPWAAIGISTFCDFCSLCLLWNGWLKQQPRSQAALLMAMAAVFPGMIYRHAISPVSLFVFLSLCFLYLAAHERWGEAFVAGVLTGTAHTTSIFLIPTMMLWMAFQWPWIRQRITKASAALLGAPLGLLLIYFIQRYQTGVWNSAARILNFHRYVDGWSILRIKEMLYIPTISQPTAETKLFVILQSLSVAVTCIAALYYYRDQRIEKEKARRVERSLILIFVIVFWIAPHLSIYRHSYYRNEAYLLPVLILLSDVPLMVLSALLLFFLIVAFFMSQQFFLSILI